MGGFMTATVSAAVIVSTALTVLVLVRYGDKRVEGRIPLPRGAFVAVLFCSGLDVGLIMFPLLEYPVYETDADYSFAHPMAIELGMWGLLIWGFYFLTAFYFLRIEPELKLFHHPVVNVVNSLVVMATCAFTGYLFLDTLPNYVPELPAWGAVVVVGLVIAFACYSASDVIFMKWLSISSMYGFFALGMLMFLFSGGDLPEYVATLGNYVDYPLNLHRFVTPIDEYHEFYLFWWFAWSIMIGQFMAKFASEMSVRMLALLMIVIPSIPLSLWFGVLFVYYNESITVPSWLNLAMVTIGVIFVVNSLDSLIRLYTDNLRIPVERLGKWRFIAVNFVIMVALVAAYRFLNFRIEHVGLVVIGLYVLTFVAIARKRDVVGRELASREVSHSLE